MDYSRQEYWSGLPCPLPEDLPDPGIEPALQADSLPLRHRGSPTVGQKKSSYRPEYKQEWGKASRRERSDLKVILEPWFPYV